MLPPHHRGRREPFHGTRIYLAARDARGKVVRRRMDPIWFSKASLSSPVVASRNRQAAPQHLTPPWTARQEGRESLTSLPSHSIPFLLVQNPSCNLTACVTTFATTKTTGPKSSTKQFKFDTYRIFFLFSALIIVVLYFRRATPTKMGGESDLPLPFCCALCTACTASSGRRETGLHVFLSVFRAGW